MTVIISLRDFLKRTAISRSKFYELRRQGKTPLPVQITERRIGFVESEVEAWLESLIATGRKAA